MSFQDKQQAFLASIKNKNGKYKRVISSPLRYAGGKTNAVGFIIEALPPIDRLISPFLGGGSVEFAINKIFDIPVIGYDIFDILINYWVWQINSPEILAMGLSKLTPNKETYAKIKERLKKHWNKEIALNSLELAIHYFFNHNLSYGPGFLGWPSSVYMNQKRYDAILERVRTFKASNFEVKCGSFEQVFQRYPNDCFYLDPPYLLNEDAEEILGRPDKENKMFRGIYPMRNITCHSRGFNHKLLAQLIHNHKGPVILSYNNCEAVRKLYDGFEQSFPSWSYTMGQGETRIGKNRIEAGNTHIKKSHEIIIKKN